MGHSATAASLNSNFEIFFTADQMSDPVKVSTVLRGRMPPVQRHVEQRYTDVNRVRTARIGCSGHRGREDGNRRKQFERNFEHWFYPLRSTMSHFTDDMPYLGFNKAPAWQPLVSATDRGREATRGGRRGRGLRNRALVIEEHKLK